MESNWICSLSVLAYVPPPQGNTRLRVVVRYLSRLNNSPILFKPNSGLMIYSRVQLIFSVGLYCSLFLLRLLLGSVDKRSFADV